MNFYNNLSEMQKGYILIAIGVLLLLYTLGLFAKFLGMILGIIALGMIGIGLMRTHLIAKIAHRFKKNG